MSLGGDADNFAVSVRNTAPQPREPQATADARRGGYYRKIPAEQKKPAARDSDSWFTPTRYVEAAREALGGVIYLDPFSSAEADKVVKAAGRYYTVTDDAFKQNWRIRKNAKHRTVWMNPPYSGQLCRQAMNKLMDEFEKDAFSEAIVLVNNGTENSWFQRAMNTAAAICFTNHRIAFWNADGKAISGNTRGQAFFYFSHSPDVERFQQAFADIGTVVVPYRSELRP